MVLVKQREAEEAVEARGQLECVAHAGRNLPRRNPILLSAG
jgi:hypothetical protein